MKRWSLYIVPLLCGIYAIFAMATLFQESGDNFWDAMIYRSAAEAHDQGSINPYDAEDLLEVHGDSSKVLGYKYPPITLYGFEVLSALDLNQAKTLWAWLLVAAMVCLVMLWSNLLAAWRDPWHFALLLLGYNSVWFIALRSGNIQVILVLLIWGAFWLYLHRKHAAFALLILLAACFKITPVLFLLLLLWRAEARRTMFIALGGFAVYMMINIWLVPGGTEFMQSLGGWAGEGGVTSPGMLSLMEEVMTYLIGHKMGGDLGQIEMMTWLGYMLFAIGILWASWRKMKFAQEPLFLFMLIVLIYALVLPRVKDYDYLIVLPTALYVLKIMPEQWSRGGVMLLFMLSAANITLPGMDLMLDWWWRFMPFVLALFSWAVLIRSPLGQRDGNS